MHKIIAGLAALLVAAACLAGADVNRSSEAELDGIKGIGPALSRKILAERKKRNFKDWNDFIGRVSGVGEKSAAKLSGAGLTVDGTPYKGAAPATAPASSKAEKPAAATTPDAKR